MLVKMKIKRFNPEKDEAPWWGEYEVECEDTDRVLDALHNVKWYHDGTLTLRRSCAMGICGSDSMRINGQNRLACKTLIKDMPKEITVEPMSLSFTKASQKRSFKVVVKAKQMTPGKIVSGLLVWKSQRHSVRSPIVVYSPSSD